MNKINDLINLGKAFIGIFLQILKFLIIGINVLTPSQRKYLEGDKIKVKINGFTKILNNWIKKIEEFGKFN